MRGSLLQRSFRTHLVVWALLCAPALAHAQTSAVIDEGTFMITQQGNPFGRESFRIVRTPAPGGQVYRATGQGSLGDNRLTSKLGTDSTGVPVSYESDLTLKGELVQHLQGRGRPGRFSILNQTRGAEAAREYVLEDGALLVDGDVIHHYSFVPLAADHATLNVIAPRTGMQVRYKLDELAREQVEIGGRSIESRHFTLTADGVRREIWVDLQGRLLKVVVPDKGLVAIRDEPPR